MPHLFCTWSSRVSRREAKIDSTVSLATLPRAPRQEGKGSRWRPKSEHRKWYSCSRKGWSFPYSSVDTYGMRKINGSHCGTTWFEQLRGASTDVSKSTYPIFWEQWCCSRLHDRPDSCRSG